MPSTSPTNQSSPTIALAKPIKKILLCQQRQIGDLVTATPTVTLMHEAFPDAEIHFMTEKKCVPILDNNPYITKVWTIDKDEKSGGGTLALYRAIRKEHFDIVVDFQQLPRLRFVSLFSGAPIRLATQGKWYNNCFYTHLYPNSGGYAAKSKASILEAFGIHWNDHRPQIFLREAEREEARTLLRSLAITEEHDCITLDVSHKDMRRAWSKANYARFVDMAYEANNAVRFLALWGPGEEDYVRDMVSMCQHQEAIVMMPKLFSLRIVAACIEAACMHVGNCSAPRHMAVAVGTPTFTTRADNAKSWTYPSAEHIQTKNWKLAQGEEVSGTWHDALTPDMVYPVFAEHFAAHKKG